MSRNVDKANSVLVRFQEIRAEKDGGYKDYSRFKRPTRVHTVKVLAEAQQWRSQLLKELGNKITQIHDPSLNEFQLRELNDDLNGLVKEKFRWERHIKDNLNGPDYSRVKRLNTVGGTVVNGYRYFGRALELPDVQQALKHNKEKRESLKSKKQKRVELEEKVRKWKKTLRPEYYGYLPEEKHRYYKATEFTPHVFDKLGSLKPSLQTPLTGYESMKTEELKFETGAREDGHNAPEHIIPEFKQIPDVKDIETWLVQKRRKRLQERLGL